MRKIIVFAALSAAMLFFIKDLKSQENFQPGYIINLNKDTVRGFIDYRIWHRNPDQIRFKNNQDGEAITYTPLDIKSFYVKDEMSYYIKDEMYKSAIVEIDVSSNFEDKLTYENLAKLRTDTVFLSVFLESTKSLLFLRDDNMKLHFFIQEGEGNIDELIYRRYLDDKMSASRVKVTEIKEYNRFRGILKYYMNDDPTIRKTIDRSSYHKQDLLKVFRQYYKNKGEDYRSYFESSKKHIKFIPKLIGGVYQNSYKISRGSFNEGGDFMTTSDLNPSNPGYTFGIGLNTISPRRRQKLSWNQELLFYSEDMDFECTIQRPFASSYWEYEYDLETIYAKYNVQMKYKENLKTISPFFHLGFTANVLLYHSGVSQKTYYNTSGAEIHGIRPSFVRAGIVGGVGAEYKQFSMDLRYEMLGMSLFNSLAKNIYFILAYSFESSKNK